MSERGRRSTRTTADGTANDTGYDPEEKSRRPKGEVCDNSAWEMDSEKVGHNDVTSKHQSTASVVIPLSKMCSLCVCHVSLGAVADSLGGTSVVPFCCRRM